VIDFTGAIEELNNYKGSEKKKTLIYDNRKYLVKFPNPVEDKNKNISYINNAFSEYVESNIFKICGFETQNTILGTYKYNGKEKIVCACEDFTDEKRVLYEFESLALSSNPEKKIETEISDIMDVFTDVERLINVTETRKLFWDMFVVDAIIGNTDRHNGNWGFIVDKDSRKTVFAPIYDCGSCLTPMLDDDMISEINETELKNLAINCYSCLRENGRKINYMTYIKQMNNSECNEAIVGVFDNIKIDEIENFIEGIECMSETRKNFYKAIIKRRYEIVKDVYEKMV